MISLSVSDATVGIDSVGLGIGDPSASVFDTIVKTEFVALATNVLRVDVSDSATAADVVRFPLTVDSDVDPTFRQASWTPVWLVDLTQVAGTGIDISLLRYAGRDVEHLDPPYHGRIVGNPTVTFSLMDTFWGFTEVTLATVLLDNSDGALDGLYGADIRNQPVILRRYDLASGVLIEEVTAKITEVGRGIGVIEIQASSPDLSIFERDIPVGTVTFADYPKAVDIGATISVVFGNVTKHPLRFISNDLVASQYDYLVGRDVIAVTAVYFVRTDGGFLQIPVQDYTVLTDAYEGLTVVRFTTPQVDFSGRALQLVADVEAPNRNFADAVKAILTDSTWGLGEQADDASFTQAAADLDAVGDLFCDGALLNERQAQDVLRDLLIVRGLRLGYTTTGTWTLTVDKEKTSAAMRLQDGMGDNERTILRAGRRERVTTRDAISLYTIRYRLDSVKSAYLFAQKRTVNASLGRDRTIENPFIRDHTTADKVIDYLGKRERFGQETCEFDVPQEGRGLREGDIVEVTYVPLAFSLDTLEVRRIEKRLESVSLLVSGWDPLIYVYEPGDLPEDLSEPTGPFLLPRPGGLEIVGQFLDQIFYDCDIVLQWHRVSEVLPGISDEDNLPGLEVRDYYVSVYVEEELRRQEAVFFPTYTYSIEKNRLDNPPVGSRIVKFIIQARMHSGRLGDPNSIICEHPEPSLA